MEEKDIVRLINNLHNFDCSLDFDYEYESDEPFKMEDYKDRDPWKVLNEELGGRESIEAFIEKHADQVHWDVVCAELSLSEEFMDRNADRLDWSIISWKQDMSEAFIERHADDMDWYNLVENGLSEALIEKYIDKMDWNVWSRIAQLIPLSEAFIERNADRVDWDSVSHFCKISEEFILKNARKINWAGLGANPHCKGMDLAALKKRARIADNELLEQLKHFEKREFDIYIRNYPVPEEMLEHFSDRIRWCDLWAYQIVSEDFIEKHIDKVNWMDVSMFQTLSEDFMERHADKICWWCVSEFQQMSEEFISKFADKVDWHFLERNSALKGMDLDAMRERCDRTKKSPSVSPKEIRDNSVRQKIETASATKEMAKEAKKESSSSARKR